MIYSECNALKHGGDDDDAGYECSLYRLTSQPSAFEAFRSQHKITQTAREWHRRCASVSTIPSRDYTHIDPRCAGKGHWILDDQSFGHRVLIPLHWQQTDYNVHLPLTITSLILEWKRFPYVRRVVQLCLETQNTVCHEACLATCFCESSGKQPIADVQVLILSNRMIITSVYRFSENKCRHGWNYGNYHAKRPPELVGENGEHRKGSNDSIFDFPD